MTFGVKTNERPGTRATLKYGRFSAYKAREVLDLIRNKPVGEARDILAFTERGSAGPIMKLLDSAVANAENNDGIAAQELYVSACYADEGPTLKRFRPRARGRASKIRKRTCHITIIVTRYSSAELEVVRGRLERSAGSTASARDARARRVAQSRERSGERAAAAAAAAEAEADDTVDDITDDSFEGTEETAVSEAVETPTTDVSDTENAAETVADDTTVDETDVGAADTAEDAEDADDADAAVKGEKD